MKEVYCDGLGACLGKCPQDAITVEEREAPEFDEEATKKHLERQKVREKSPLKPPGGCPGTKMMTLNKRGFAKKNSEQKAAVASELGNWPVQLKLAPVEAPFFEDAELVLAADCTGFALPDFHWRILGGKALVIGCPKLDEADIYVEKLAEIVRCNRLKSITVVRMEVPCCGGLVRILEQALELSGKEVPAEEVIVSIGGDIKERTKLDHACRL